MTITIFTKDGEPTTQINNVAKIQTMYLNRRTIGETLLNLQIELESGETVEYYLSDYDRFAIIEK